MGATAEGTSFLTFQSRRARRPRWVLRWIGHAPSGSLRSVLREDMGRLATLSHPALAAPVSFGVEPETREGYVLRPYVEGSEMLAALHGRAPKEILPWLLSAASALGILHRFGLLHRNLKPSNFIIPRAALFTRQPRGPGVVLCDPAWWPDREARATTALDLHALGKVFYRVLTGRDPEVTESGLPPSPSELNPAVPLDLERLVLKLLHPDPSKRYPNAASLMEDLYLLSGGKRPPPAPAPECFLGRDSELKETLACLSDPMQAAALAITGEAGMGKSAFLRRLAVEAEVLGHRTVLVRFYPESSIPFAPLRSILDEIMPSGDRGRALRVRYRRLLDETRAEKEPAVQDPGKRRAFLKGLRAILQESAQGWPTLLLLDDAHLSDPLTLELLAGVLRESAPTRLSLAISLRTESPFRQAAKPLLDALRASERRKATIELSPLSPKEVDEWLQIALFDDLESREALRPAHRLRGQPLAVQEAIRTRAKRKSFPTAGSSLPSSYLEGLPEAEKLLLELLAVLGRPASSGLLEVLVSAAGPRLRASLDALLQEGTLIAEGGVYFFRHGGSSKRERCTDSPWT